MQFPAIGPTTALKQAREELIKTPERAVRCLTDEQVIQACFGVPVEVFEDIASKVETLEYVKAGCENYNRQKYGF